MAASRVIQTISVWPKILQRSLQPVTSIPNQPSVSVIQVRHKNNRQHIKEAKVQADKNEKFIPKKLRKLKVDIKTASVETKSTILAQSPVDNVWIRKYYPPPQFSLEETIERHKAFAQPAMLNNMNGLLFLDMRLDYTTKKKTKFIQNIRSTLRLPHEFPYGSPPNILVFCKSEENMKLATSLGAKHVGTPEAVVKMIETGVVNPKDFHHVLCTLDCASDILPVRSHFRDKFPQKAKGNIGQDLQIMWDLFYYGYTYESQKITDALGSLQVPLGLLEQPTEHLVENFTAYINSICHHRSLALGPFIQTITVVAPPSPEQFLVKVEDYVPGYKNEQVDSDEEEEEAAEAAS